MNPIEQYSPFHFNKNQRNAANLISAFFDDPNAHAFILHGHAGTGKTTIIQALIAYLRNMEIPVVLLASTGRAAKIVAEKARFSAETVHKHIYIIDKEQLDEEKKIRRLSFKLRENTFPKNAVFIVDECSMISDHNSGSVFIQYGSGRLLADFFIYAANRKVIFSGDPSQLPPVKFPYSPALNAQYLGSEHKKTVKQAGLDETMRFSRNSGIFRITDSLRRKVAANSMDYLRIMASGFDDVEVIFDKEAMIDHYVERIRATGLESQIFITLSNKQANEVNLRVRQMLFRKYATLHKGELLMVVQNNYLHNVANGEHITVEEISPTTEKRAGLTFRKIKATVGDLNGQRLISAFIIEDLLLNLEPSLGNEHEARLFIDFIIRTKEKGIKQRDPAFLDALLRDPYLNALRVKYGYAVTCHKAQGGEWPHVYVMLEGSLFYQDINYQHRWAYTALSRSSKKLYLLSNRCIF
jgi:ATP-dependent exoDNAse (exonuclease V) alpha subunit